jgi:hypothetical protein
MNTLAGSPVGVRAPRLRSVPPYERTYGPEVVDLAELAGLKLDGWQADVLADFCAVSPTNRWNTLECALIVGRQNGKSAALEAYLLGCLYLFDDPLIMYSAHRFASARETFLRVKQLIEGCHDLSRRVRRVSEAHGKEGIELKTGQRLLFHARGDKAGRGFSGDKNVLDEAFLLDGATMSAIMPTMAARPNPQIVYASSAGWEISEQLGKLRRRALASICARLAGEGLDAGAIAVELGLELAEVERHLRRAGDGPDGGLAFLEWSAPGTVPLTRQALSNRQLWAQANPALGIRITPEFIEAELRTMGLAEFARERLGISTYPPDDEDDAGWEVIAESAWVRRALPEDDRPRPGAGGLRRVAFAADVRPDRSAAAIGAAFRDESGRLIVEVVNHKAGTGWVVPRLVELHGRYATCAVAVDTVGPASSLIEDLKAAGVEVLELTGSDVAQAFGQVHAALEDGGDLYHLDQAPLNEAVRGATTRPLGDRLTWDRRGEVDISPLVAVTNAAHAHLRTAREEVDPLQNIW